jgi:hypothetical protein
MPETPRQTVLRAVLPILSEALAGPADPRSTHVVDNVPDRGVFGTLDGLTAEQASMAVEDGDSTAAAHAEHVRSSLDVPVRWMRGEREKTDWARSGDVTEVDDVAWTELRARLRGTYGAFVEMTHQQPVNDELLEGLAGTVAHAACHPGALRRMAKHAAGRAGAAA